MNQLSTILLALFLFTGIPGGIAFPNSIDGLTDKDDKVSLLMLLQEWEDQYNVIFTYDRRIIQSLEVEKPQSFPDQVSEALNDALYQTDLRYTILEERYIILYNNTEEGIQSLQRMVEHMHKILEERKNVPKRKVSKVVEPLKWGFLTRIKSLVVDSEITGRVVDADGNPLIGVTVRVKGTSRGTITDMNGNYEIVDLEEDDVLIFTYVGKTTQEIRVGDNTVLNVTLVDDAEQLQEVVVTALGIKRDQKSLGYSVAEVSGEDITTVTQENPINALAGRVPGLTLNQTGGVGSTSSVVIRGMTSLTTDNQPLYVIDGVPVESGLNNVRDMGDRNSVDYGSPIADLNPDDISNISVLKGPSAAALYGSRAANGVILISTKTGAQGEKMKVDFSSSNVFENPYKFLNFHYRYASGNRGNRLDESSAYWVGPELDVGNKAVQWNSPLDENGNPIPTELRSYPDNMKNFLNTGFTTNNNISLRGGGSQSTYRVSYGNMTHNGLVPGSDLFRNSLSSVFSHNFNEDIKISTNINYVRSHSNNRGSSGSRGSALEAVYDFPHIDIRDQRQYWIEGREHIEQRRVTEDGDNPYFLAMAKTNSFVRNRLYGNVRLDYTILPGLSAFARIALNRTDENRESKIPWSYSRMPEGGYFLWEIGHEEINTDFLLSYDRRFENFDFTVSAGGNYLNKKYDDLYNGVSGRGRGLVIPGLYRISNIPRDILTTVNFSTLKKMYSLYGLVSVGIKDQLYIDFTGRNDWSSTLPSYNRSFFYPSVSASWLLNETFELPRNVSLLKFRAGWAQVGNDTDPYQLEPVIGINSLSGYPSVSTSISGRLLNPQLKPEIATSIEYGIDVNLYQNRFRFEATYYDMVNRNQILDVGTPSSSGYDSKLINAGKLESKGWEVLIGGTPLRTENWRGEININFSRNRTTIVELADGIDRIQLWDENGGGSYGRVGEELGAIYSRGYAQVEDPNSPYYRWPILDNQGSWQRLDDPQDWIEVGNFNPDFLLGGQMNLSYKRFSVNASMDWRVGGEFLSFTYRYGESDWKSQRQIDNLIPGGLYSPEELVALLKSDPEKYIIPQNGNFPRVGGYTKETGGLYTDFGGEGWDGGFIPGVKLGDDGEYIEVLGGPGTFIAPISDIFAWRFNQQVAFDASFIKLREVSFGYDIPPFRGVNNLKVSLFARNLLLWTAANIGIDPERAFTRGGSFQGDTRMMFKQGIEWQNVVPFTVSFGFNVNMSF